jgi:hypothetical protein
MSEAKRAKFEAAVVSLDGDSYDALRQSAWVQRSQATIDDELWRPPKVHRVAAKTWIEKVDNQIRQATVHPGWILVQFIADNLAWLDPYKFPKINVCIDYGGDGLCACNALLYRYDCNIVFSYDSDHLTKRKFEAVMRACGLWSFCLLLLIVLNLDFGPYTDETRKGVISAVTRWFYTNRRADQVPLFVATAPNMLRDVQFHGLTDLPGLEDPERELYAFLAGRSRASITGRRLSMCRYGAFTHSLRKFVPWWNVVSFERQLVALETDVLRGKAFKDKLVSELAHTSEVNDATSTSMRRLSIADKTLRDMCANAVAVSVATLAAPQHLRVASCICVSNKLVEKRAVERNKALRSVKGNLDFLAKSVNGGHMRDLEDNLKLLEDPEALQEATFVLPAPGTAWGVALATDDLFDLTLIIEDELADVFGQIVVCDIAQDILRTLREIAGWPISCVQCLDNTDDTAPRRCMDRFRADKDVFEVLKGSALTRQGKKVLARSPFQTRPVKMFDLCLFHAGYEMTSQLRERLLEDFTGLFQTQVVEDINAIMKNCTELVACRRQRKQATLFAHVLQSGLVTQRHKFENPKGNVPTVMRSTKLSDETWHPSAACSIDITDLAGTAASTEWWSPGPPNVTTPDADCFVLRELKAADRLAELDNLWMGELCDASNKMILAYVCGEGPADYEYYHALFHWPTSGVLLWKVKLKQVPSTQYMYAEYVYGEALPTIRPLTSLEPAKYRVYLLTWKSWLWQARHCSAWATVQTPAVRPFIDDVFGLRSLLEAANWMAWWKMSRTSILKFMKATAAIPDGSDLFDVLWHSSKAVLALSDENTLKRIHRRLVRADGHDDTSAVLLDMDDYADVLDKTDVEALKVEQQRVKRDGSESDQLANKYTARARLVYPEPKAKAKGRGRGRGRGAIAVALPIFSFDTTHADATRMLPPGASIWRARIKGGWMAHLPPNPRISAMFQNFATQGHALQDVLQRLWRAHLFSQGRTIAACPVPALFA